MSRLSTRFASLKEHSRTALIPFVTAGDPQPDVTVNLMHAMVKVGADILELGVPFSDPMAEGPVIQRACERALAHNVSVRDVLAMVKEFRQNDDETPVVLMGYLNPVEVMGYDTFAREAALVGVDGVITVDLPPEEAKDYLVAFKKNGLDPVFLLAPTSTKERISLIAAAAGGFVYYVSLKGVTGSSHLDLNDVETKLSQIRQQVSLPIAVGFGIKDAATAAAVAQLADAVVVGSALVNRIGELADQPDKILETVPAFLATLRAAVDERVVTE